MIKKLPLSEAIYTSKYKGKIIVIKASGDVFEPANSALKHNLFEQLAHMKQVGMHPILIHGGGGQITQALKSAGHARIKDDEGNYLSSDADIDLTVQTLNDLNADICSSFNQVSPDIKAMPLSAVTPLVTANPLTGRTATVAHVNTDALMLAAVADPAIIPVMHSIGVDENGLPYNINADDVASAVAKALNAERLIFLSKENGVLDQNGKTISFLTPDHAQKLIDSGVIYGGMKKKVTQMLDVAGMIGGVVTLNANEPDGIWHELIDTKGSSSGTLITNDLEAYFQASVTHSSGLTMQDKLGFKALEQKAEMLGNKNLKSKPLHVLDQNIHLVSVKKGEHQRVGQCLLTDCANDQVDYLGPYPNQGKMLVLTSLFMDAGHGSVKGAVRRGMGPTSILFNAVNIFAAQNDYEFIVAKVNMHNKDARAMFEDKEFTPSSPFTADNENYTSILYVKEVSPVAP